jgi:hypothetical protein
MCLQLKEAQHECSLSSAFVSHVTQAPTPPIISTGFRQVRLNSMKAQHACA